MKKIVLLTILVFIGNSVFSQLYLPQEIPCLNYNDLIAYQNGQPTNIHSIHCVDISNYNTIDNQTISAGNTIKLNPNTHLNPNNTKQVHAYIQKYDVAWFEPITVLSVGKNDKLELGIHLADEYNDKVLNFVNNLNGDSLNPFNPENIDIYAVFSTQINVLGYVYNVQKRVNAFYYEEYMRNTNDWTELSTPYNFRIRFTPTFIGEWDCEIHVIINETDTLTTSNFKFDCVNSNNKGFMKVGANKRYFTIDKKTFFPVGRNLQDMDTLDYFSQTNGASPGAWSSTPLPAYRYLLYHELLGELKLKGANYFRFLIQPWMTEIEFEHLNNYSDRMSNAWEFDRILDVCKDLDLRMQLNMQIHFAFETPSGYAMTNWDWPKKGDPLNIICVPSADSGYCYNRELGIENALDFLTNTEAIKYYKYRLRYIISRWGYSTNIAALELVSEINSIGSTAELKKVYNYFTNPNTGLIDSVFVGCKGVSGSGTKPYPSGWNPNNLPCISCNNIFKWQTEMFKYIKEDLGHTEHLLTFSYAGKPITTEDSTWFSSYVDFLDYNKYYGMKVLHYVDEYNKTVTLSKPFMHSETDIGKNNCDGDVTNIKDLYLQPFTGIAVAGMNWVNQYNQNDIWRYMKFINYFMSGVSLDEDNYQPLQPMIQPQDSSLMTMALVSDKTSDNSRKAIGAICNNTFNYYTQATGIPCNNTPPSNHIPPTATNYNLDYLNSPIVFVDFGVYKNYTVNYYNALTGVNIATLYTNSNLFGKLDISMDIEITGDYTQPIILFEIIPDGYNLRQGNINNINAIKSKQVQPLKTINKRYNIPLNINQTVSTPSIYTMPNPTSGVINVSVKDYYGLINYTVTDMNGKIIMKNSSNLPNFLIDLSVYENGVYLLKCIISNKPYYFKIIKQ